MKARISSLVITLVIAFALFHPLQAQTPTSGTVNTTANLRSGPGTTYAVVGSLAAGAVVEITACNEDCTWYQVGDNVWISATLVTATSVAPTAIPLPLPNTNQITIVGWNVESGGALQSAVADRLGSFQDVDIWGLSEVNAIDAEAFEFGAETGEGANYEFYLGTTGSADRLLLIWDEDRFDLLTSGSIPEIGLGARAPLWVALRETATSLDFIVMVNHLHRSNEETRHRQAEMLNAWAASQVMPVIALGDYNFDWNLPVGETDHDAGYDNMTKDGVWEWIRPAELVTTQCSGWPCGYTSVLDFVFAAGPAREWYITSQIIVTENDFPDDFTTPDHRPVMAVIQPMGTVVAPVVLVPTATSSATNGVAPTATAATTCPQTNGTANFRSGPGTGYAVVGSKRQGECLTITGRTEVGDWFELGPNVWIASFLVANPPAMATVPVVEALTTIPPIAGDGCDPSYPTLCIPIGEPDVDCGDIANRNFTVLPPDPHRLDGDDDDGIGCEGNAAPSSARSFAKEQLPATSVQPTATPQPPAPTPLPVQAQPTPVPPTALPPTTTPAPQPAAPSCDPNYTGACIPQVGYDLDCPEVGVKDFNSVGSDPHGFDRDGDGLACES